MRPKWPVPGIPDVLIRFGASARLIQQAFVIAIAGLAAFALACLLPVGGDRISVPFTAALAVVGVLLWLGHLVAFAYRIAGAAPEAGGPPAGRLARAGRIAGIVALAATGAPVPEPPDPAAGTDDPAPK